MEPATSIIKSIGGASKVAAITGVHRTRVYGWMKSKEKGGTGGLIPISHIKKLITAARAIGVELSGDDFIPGAKRRCVHNPSHGPSLTSNQPPENKSVEGEA